LTMGAYDRTSLSRAATSLLVTQARHSASAVPAVGRELDANVASTEIPPENTRRGSGAGAGAIGVHAERAASAPGPYRQPSHDLASPLCSIGPAACGILTGAPTRRSSRRAGRPMR